MNVKSPENFENINTVFNARQKIHFKTLLFDSFICHKIDLYNKAEGCPKAIHALYSVLKEHTKFIVLRGVQIKIQSSFLNVNTNITFYLCATFQNL